MAVSGRLHELEVALPGDTEGELRRLAAAAEGLELSLTDDDGGGVLGVMTFDVRRS